MNTTLTSLDLSTNEIGSSGGISIANLLKKNKTIRSLELNGNFNNNFTYSIFR